MANIITVSRIILSLPLLFIALSSPWFYILYIFCGLTDMFDGMIARKTGTVSNFGAKLDTASDFVFMLVCFIRILPLLHIPVWLWVWIILIAVTKICNMAFVSICKKRFISNHSVLNKITGFALFLLPLTLTFAESAYSVSIISVLATVAAMQEAYFIAKGKGDL
ncbi:MAG: CDP-alcohol phosphatidyltransferase family protein [Ruminococcaceae bacterium]|nr:CDP-alcohol phosphatidyltransferase family protein [Oscillospiraceae bacterium]